MPAHAGIHDFTPHNPKRTHQPPIIYDALKATLTNCLRSGPTAQNRDNHPDFRRHLEGRIAWIAQINPQKAAKLHLLFDQINFPP